MVRSARFVALGATMLLCGAASAQSTPAPPNWQDGRGPSVYLTPSQCDGNCAECNKPTEPTRQLIPGRYAQQEQPERSVVVPAAYTNTTGNDASSGRRLAPPSKNDELAGDPSGHRNGSSHRLVNFGIPSQSICTVVTGLAIVIGAFLLFAWAMRRGGRASKGRRGMLPADAVGVLGRVPLAARQFAQLLRVGNKLVLVAMTPGGPKTITEVTDPVEVDRLLGLCQQYEPTSATNAFEHVFQQFSSEPTNGGFLESEPLPASLSAASLAYRSQRGAVRA